MKRIKIGVVLCALLLLVISGCTETVSQKKLVPGDVEKEESVIPTTEQPKEISQEVVEDIEDFDA